MAFMLPDLVVRVSHGAHDMLAFSDAGDAVMMRRFLPRGVQTTVTIAPLDEETTEDFRGSNEIAPSIRCRSLAFRVVPLESVEIIGHPLSITILRQCRSMVREKQAMRAGVICEVVRGRRAISKAMAENVRSMYRARSDARLLEGHDPVAKPA
jgi:hypothetical protein